jgi:hypothetical protein
MNHNKFSLLILSLSIVAISCKKSFLDVEDNSNSQIPRQQYVKDLNSTQQFLNGIYALFASNLYAGASPSQIYPDLIADNIKLSNSPAFLASQYNWNQVTTTNTNDVMVNFWINCYTATRACSFIIEKSQEFESQDEAKAKKMKAEAYAIRALAHFLLVNTFAQSYNFSSDGSHPGIPYITTSDWTQPYIRNTVAEVYADMITDLTNAITLFQPGTNNTLVMNQNAAKALLGRIYLFKEDWHRAKTVAMEVSNAVPLMPSPLYPSKLFTLQESEALLQLAPSSTIVLSGSYDTYFQGWYFRNTARFLATKDIADLLKKNPNDVRKSWIASGGIGKDSIIKYPINVIPGYAVGPTDVINPARSYYQTLLRSSEMFLTVAEAAAKTGDETTARTYLDAIRKRADPTAINSTATGLPLLDSIYTERRKELAFEGLRMFDLLRWKKGVNRLDVSTGSPTTLSYPNNKAIAPIPGIDAQSGIAQNPDY